MEYSWILWLIGVICAVWVIVDVLTKQRKFSTGQKVIWVILAIVFSIITAIVYYFMYKNK